MRALDKLGILIFVIKAFIWAPFVLPMVASGASLPDTIDAVRESIVAVGTIIPTRRPPGIFLATGFVVADGTHVITNAHALPSELDYLKKESLAILIQKKSKAEALKVELVRMDQDHDVSFAEDC